MLSNSSSNSPPIEATPSAIVSSSAAAGSGGEGAILAVGGVAGSHSQVVDETLAEAALLEISIKSGFLAGLVLAAAKIGKTVMAEAIDDLVTKMNDLKYLETMSTDQRVEIVDFWRVTMFPVLLAYAFSKVQEMSSPEDSAQLGAIKERVANHIVEGFKGKIDTELNDLLAARMEINQRGQDVLPGIYIGRFDITKLGASEVRSARIVEDDEAPSRTAKKGKTTGLTKRHESSKIGERKSEIESDSDGIFDESGKQAGGSSSSSSALASGGGGGKGTGSSAKVEARSTPLPISKPSIGSQATGSKQKERTATDSETESVINNAQFKIGESVKVSNEGFGQITEIDANFKRGRLVPVYTVQMFKKNSKSELAQRWDTKYDEDLSKQK